MKKKSIFIIFFILLILIFGVGYLVYSSRLNGVLDFVTQKQSSTSESSNLTSVFNVDESPRVNDPDLGIVLGVPNSNKVAEDFMMVFHGPNFLEGYDAYTKFTILSKNDSVAEATVDKGTEVKQYKITCESEKTALFKDFNMTFVTSGGDALQTLSDGDLIYSRCGESRCSEVGPECIIVKILPR